MDMFEGLEATNLAMEDSIDSLKKALTGIRTSRADPGLLDNIKIEVYGSSMPLNQVATIVAEGASSLKVTPWDKSNLSDIEKAISLSDIGIMPNSDGFAIRLNLPPMTQERRQEYVKLAKASGEKTKVSVRNARRDYLAQVKAAVKNKLLTEDDEHRAQSEIQKITDKYIESIDKIVSDKEKELLNF